MSPKPVRTLNIYDKGSNYLILDSDEQTPLYNIHWNGSSAPHMTVTRPLDPEPQPIVGTATYHAQKIGGFFASASKITLKIHNRVIPLNKSGNVFSLNKRSLESISGQTLYWKGGVAASGFLKLVDGNGEIVAKYENRAYSGVKMGVIEIMREMNEEEVDEVVVSGCATISEEKTSMMGTAAAISSAGGAQVAALITAIATSEVISCWNDSSIDANQAIANILKALHHPFYIDFNNPNKLQKSMFDIVTMWWDDKSPNQQNTLRDLLKKSTIESGRNKLLILNPEEWHNQRTFGKRPEEDKSLVNSLVDNITDAVKKGVINISQPVLDKITKTIRAIPTPDIPNPVDLALSMVPKAIPTAKLFERVSEQAINAAPTMENPLKDVVIVALNIVTFAPSPLAPVISSIGNALGRLWR